MAEGKPSKIQLPKPSKNPLNRLKLKYQGMDAYSRHKQLINNYILYYPGSSIHEKFKRDDSKDRNDYDIIRENHQFLWNDKDISEAEKSWDKKLAKKYYDKLFKEYCIADLSRYQENKVAMRWRTENEVKNGKGQFICGDKRCDKTKGLDSWEVNFVYIEHGSKKQALVKLRLCPECSAKLNYHSTKRKVSKQVKSEEKKKRKHKKKHKHGKKKRKRHESSSSSSSESESSDSDEEIKKKKSEEDVEIKRKEEEAKIEAEASNIWSKEPEEDKHNPEEDMDKFLDDLLF